MLHKLRATPGFLEEARRARKAYASQLEAAQAAFDKWRDEEDWPDGEPVFWRHRPEASAVSLRAGL